MNSQTLTAIIEGLVLPHTKVRLPVSHASRRSPSVQPAPDTVLLVSHLSCSGVERRCGAVAGRAAEASRRNPPLSRASQEHPAVGQRVSGGSDRGRDPSGNANPEIDWSHRGPNGRIGHGGPRNQWRDCREIAARSAHKSVATSRRSLIQGCIGWVVAPCQRRLRLQVALEKRIERWHGCSHHRGPELEPSTRQSTLSQRCCVPSAVRIGSPAALGDRGVSAVNRRWNLGRGGRRGCSVGRSAGLAGRPFVQVWAGQPAFDDGR